MQNAYITAYPQGLDFFQSGLGLTLLLLAALLVMVCVLLTILVVSLGASQRTLVARAEAANKLLLQIRERLLVNDAQLSMRRKQVISEPRLQPKQGARGDTTDVFKSIDEPRLRQKRATRARDGTDVFKSVDI